MTPPTTRRRGRPAAVRLSLADVADLLAWPVETLRRVLDRHPGVLPGAVLVSGEWEVPESALRALLGQRTGALPTMASVEQVAEYLGRSDKTVYRLLQLRDPATGAPLLPAVRVLGQYRVRVSDVLRLPSAYPDWAPPRPHFFSEEDAA
jgi:hypothetical protein